MTSPKHTKLSVVAPMYNESEIIGQFIDRAMKTLSQLGHEFELILVDDGSKDNTVAIAKQKSQEWPHLRIITFSRNYGHEIASTAGLEHATGDYVVLLDSDCQHPPELIPDLLAKAQEGYDVVYAARQNREHQSWLQKKCAQWFYRFSRAMTGFEINEQFGNFRLLSRRVVDSLKQMKESNRHLLMLFAYVGYKTTSIPYICEERGAGQSKYSYRKLLNLALDSIISFSHRPLRYMSVLSIMISLVLTFYAGFIVLQKMFLHQHLAEGMASIIFIISGLFAVLFFFLAIISEYISRILVESKNRPLYIIQNLYDSESVRND